MWFDTWSDVVRVLLVGAAAYTTLIVLLRISGKRTLAKLNAFDLVVTVAVGSTLATILLSSDVSYVEGAAALALLVALQFAAALLSARSQRGRMALKSTPTLLMSDGRFLEDVLRRQRVSTDEVRQAVRSSGSGDVADVAAVVLETDGSLSVITAQQAGDGSSLVGVDGVSAVSGQGRGYASGKHRRQGGVDERCGQNVGDLPAERRRCGPGQTRGLHRGLFRMRASLHRVRRRLLG